MSTWGDSLSPRRILSYSSQNSFTSSRSSLPPGSEAPTSAIPEDERSRPSDVVINRLHEVKRVTKSLSTYFEGLAASHASHSASLLKLSTDPKSLQTPFSESSLFIPAPVKGQPASPLAQQGWTDLLSQIKEENRGVADEHKALSDKVTKDVVTPLKKLRVDIKTHITTMEKEITKVADVVLKERELSVFALSHLSRSLHPPPQPSGLPPLPTTASDDPYLHSVAADQQIKSQTVKENELLVLVQGWQEKSEKLEKEVWAKVNECWTAWEGANSTMLLGNQQRSVLLYANVDSVPPEAEWNYFSKLNYLLPATIQPQSLDTVTHIHRGEQMTLPVHHGFLERQKRFVKTWKPAYFILTPSGNLHEYKGDSAPLDKPLASLSLKECTLGPMPTPSESIKGRPLEAMFTIEGGDGSRNVFRAKSWEELGSWWSCIEQYTKVLPSPTTPLEEDGHEGDIAAGAPRSAMAGVAGGEDGEELHPEAGVPVGSPPLPSPPHTPSLPVPTSPSSLHGSIIDHHEEPEEPQESDLGIARTPSSPHSVALPSSPPPTRTPLMAQDSFRSATSDVSGGSEYDAGNGSGIESGLNLSDEVEGPPNDGGLDGGQPESPNLH